jgi:hypothetical protein
MSNVNAVQYLGTGTDDVDLALKIYSGVFTEAWRAHAKLFTSDVPVIHRKTMAMGKSYQVLAFAEMPEPEQEYTPGIELLGQNYAVDEYVITRDKYVIEHNWVPRDAMRTDHFEILPRIAKTHARKIPMTIDRRLFITSALAARAAAKTKNGLNVNFGGNRVTRTGGSLASAYPKSATGAANFRADLRNLGQLMDEDNIPPDDRWLWITPYMAHVLSYDNSGQVFSRDYIETTDGNNVMRREVRIIDGFKVIDERVNTTTNNGSMPDQNITTGPTKYQADFSVQSATGSPVALALCQGPEGDAAVSMGTWETVQNFVQYYPDKLSWLVASFILCGIGQMSPQCAGSIEVIT